MPLLPPELALTPRHSWRISTTAEMTVAPDPPLQLHYQGVYQRYKQWANVIAGGRADD